MIKKIIALAGILLLVSIVIINIIDKPQADNNVIDVTGNTEAKGGMITAPGDSGLDVGQLAPEIKLETLSGETIQLSDLKGKKVFINFWATWCPPCKKEMPDMQKFYEEYSDEVEILAVNATGQEKGIKTVKEFIDNDTYTYPILLDKELNVTEDYQAFALPTTYFIGTDGVIQQPRKVGPMTYDFMVEMTEKLK
ncbi:TlpA family protein disulfide reductase [Virgibacillus flavescens]|uniref:TlpA family protein disulfide reductase n=1 Tax=Virgibacillus flavescens TaxID=1611422 RepID=UPI003D346A38